ncbi:MAG: tRNA-dihydrouridine synthase, partial [Halobacteriovoraceae bacterium]|nr:tRNA-dihydrouridine synthase [Halobacteriovoraceae bacterium]
PLTQARMKETQCKALMLGRGPLRDPFIFLTSYADNPYEEIFTPRDYWEIILVYYHLYCEYSEKVRSHLIQMRKMIVWFVAGFDGASDFRGKLFKAQSVEDVLKLTEDYLLSLEGDRSAKKVDLNKPFMMGGHG